jgi:hypothetical protein
VAHDRNARLELLPRGRAATARDFRVHGAAQWIAGIDCTGVVVVYIEGCPGLALANGITALFPVAEIVVRATDARGNRSVLYPARRVARV